MTKQKNVKEDKTMITIKSYTDIEQSKKLAEILPIESADMYYWHGCERLVHGNNGNCDEYDIPCWSLAALLGVLAYPYIEENFRGKWVCKVEENNTTYLSEESNPIDACYDIILRLSKDLNLFNDKI